MTKVCRLCLSRLQRGSKYFNINAVESFTGFMPYRDQLTTCIPEMALDLIPNPVICNNCRNSLKSSCDFKSRCLLVEKKIRQYVESQPCETTFNLAEIDTSSLPKSVKFEETVHKETVRPILPKRESFNKAETNSSILSNLLTVCREEVILPNPSEIEITNVHFGSSPPTSKGKKSAIKQEQSISYTPIEKDEHGLFSCNHCSRKFTNVPALHSHKTKVHEEDYLCNFCNIPFKTLQNLRKHNQLCQKARGSPGTPPSSQSSQTVLTKRPHLPTKAKNHLKRWLFNHTDHPYPTDVEKQQLMKETNLSLLQVENWFINARRRILADLTRLKNMRGGLFRGRRSGRGRGRGKIYINTSLEDDMFEPVFENDQEETMTASRLLRDLNETDASCMNPLEDSAEGENESYEIENNEADDSEDLESIIPQYNIIANVENIEDQDEEVEEEEDPLGDNNSLSDLTSHIKMEIDIDER